MNLTSLETLSALDVRAIWKLVGAEVAPRSGRVAWSFEGNGVRTRATFLEAFRRLGLAGTELPGLLKSGERPGDVAGYLDPLFDLYVIRESNHPRLAEFAAASARPVINAMSKEGHPCEVLTDAYFIDAALKEITSARICLWGPPTNVFRSWHELAHVLGIEVVHVCAARWHEPKPKVVFQTSAPAQADIVITDGWPDGAEGESAPLTETHLARMGSPALLPTPPFTIGRELEFDPLGYAGFTGYRQKALLLPVQMAIIRHLLDRASSPDRI
jgi:ornithine carbamoyltransferase